MSQNIGVRKSSSLEQRVVEILTEGERNYIESLKSISVDSSAPLSGLGGQGTASPNQGPGGAFLPLGGGVMSGPIAFNPTLTEIINNEINVAENALFVPRIILGGEGGDLNDILERITGNSGATFPGRMLSIQGIVGETITIKHLFNGGGGGDIRTPRGGDFVLVGEQNITLIFDSINDEWTFMDGGLLEASIPEGTVENEHLEWDNVGKNWVAVQSETHGSTGPFATTGFHRFANNVIMLSARNAADSGNVELKVDASDFFDFTRDDNGATTIRIRSQNAIDPDQVFSLSQQSGIGGGSIFTNPNFYQFDVGATVILMLDEPNAGEGRIKFAGTPAFDRFQVAFENDTYFTGSGTPGRLNVVSSGVNVFTFQSDGASFLGSSKLFFNAGGFIEFAGTSPTSGQVRFANNTIGLTWRGVTAFNVELKVDTSGAFDFTRDDNQPIVLKIRSQDAVLADNLLTISQSGGAGAFATFNAPGTYQFETGATVLLVLDEPASGQGRIKFAGTPAFDRFQVAFETDTYFTGSGTAGRLNVVSSGVNIFTFQTNGASFLGTSTNLFFNGGYIQMLERGTKPTAVANTAQMYSKDVATVTKMFIQFSNGTEIEIGAGGVTDKIEEGDSHVEVIDTGTGVINFQVDGTIRLDLNASRLNLAASDLRVPTGRFINFITSASSANSGSQSLPANPAGFIRVKVGGTERSIPFYPI